MPRRIPGDVIELPLPSGQYAYGRVYRDATVAFYTRLSNTPGQPPLGSDDNYAFVVGVHDSAFARAPVVRSQPFPR